MELRDYIDEGAKKAGSLTALATILGISQPRASKVRAYAEPMPLEVSVKLANYINADKFSVIAAAKYAAEKTEEKKAFWRPFVEHAKAASIALVALLIAVNFVTPSPAEATTARYEVRADFVLCKIRKLIGILKKRQLLRSVLELLEGMFEAMKTNLTGRIAQM